MEDNKDNIGVELVRPEDVVIEQKSEFKPAQHLVDILMRGRRNMINMFDNLGFKGFNFVHPRYGYNVDFFAKKDIVVMIDYHGSNVMSVEILNEEEKEWFIESVEEHLGSEDAEFLTGKGDGKHGK